MAFKYNPKDANECLPAGEYDAEISAVEEKRSKAGNEMLEIIFSVFQPGRAAFPVREYIVHEVIYKLKKIARALGQLKEFEDGLFDVAAYRGRVVKLVLKVKQQDGYADKNEIKDYKSTRTVAPEDVTDLVPGERPAGNYGADDDIPF